MKVSEALATWGGAAQAAKSGERYVCIGNMRLLSQALRWFKDDSEAHITVVSDQPVGQFSHVILIEPGPTKELKPFLLLVV
jgi:hypothetical protein